MKKERNRKERRRRARKPDSPNWTNLPVLLPSFSTLAFNQPEMSSSKPSPNPTAHPSSSETLREGFTQLFSRANQHMANNVPKRRPWTFHLPMILVTAIPALMLIGVYESLKTVMDEELLVGFLSDISFFCRIWDLGGCRSHPDIAFLTVTDRGREAVGD